MFNRYSVPGAAHNKYWEDQELFKWILARAVDRTIKNRPDPPEWFRRKAYRKLLSRIYAWAPRAVVAFTFFTLSLALLAESWQAVATAAVAFAVVVLLGRRLIDLSIWWRQIQRTKSRRFWDDSIESGPTVDECLPNATEAVRCKDRGKMEEREQDKAKEMQAKRYRRWIWFTPLLCVIATIVVTWCWFELHTCQNWFIDFGSSVDQWFVCISKETNCSPPSLEFFWALIEGWVGKLAMFLVLAGLVVFVYGRFFVLPKAYRTPASTRDTYAAEWQTALSVVLTVPFAAALTYFFSVKWFSSLEISDVFFRHFSFLALLATTAYTYRWRRYMIVKKQVGESPPPDINYDEYANPATKDRPASDRQSQ